MALTRITKGVIKPNENYDTHNINSTGIVTAIGLDVNGNGDISGNLSVGGVLTYEDVTSIDSVGIITARDGIHVGAGVSAVGVGTFGGLDVNGNGDVSGNLVVGSLLTASGLDINGDIDVDGHTNLDNVSIAGVTTVSGNFFISNNDPSLTFIDENANPDFKIRGNGGSLKFIDVTDNNADRMAITNSGNVLIHKDLDVDGHTNLDNVSIAGVTTCTGLLTAENEILVKGAGTILELQAHGGPSIGLKDTNGNSFAFVSQSGGTFKVSTSANSYSTKLAITPSGDVGINTEVPVVASGYANLSLVNTTGGQIEIKRLSGDIRHYIWGDGNLNLGAGYVNGSSSNIIFSVNGASEKVRITSDGKVGIANASPLYRLDIGDGANDPPSGYQFRINAAGDYIFALAKQGNASFSIRNNSTSVVHLNTQNSKRLALGVSSGSNSGSIEEHVNINSSGSLIVGSSSYGAAGSFSVGATGTFRQVLASGTSQDTLIGAISGVSNGFQITTDSNNAVSYKFHNGSTNTNIIKTNGYFGTGTSNPVSQFVVSKQGGEGVEFVPGNRTDENDIYHYDRGSNVYCSYRTYATKHEFWRAGSAQAVEVTPAGNLKVYQGARIRLATSNDSDDSWVNIQSDNHYNVIFGLNLHLNYSGNSGTHQVKQRNTHGTIGSAGMFIGGNGSNNNSNISFFRNGQGSGANTVFSQDSWKFQIASSIRQNYNLMYLQRGYFKNDTNNSNANNFPLAAGTGIGGYAWGYQEAFSTSNGIWTHPYPDLVIGYHTGLRFGGNTSYGGCRFFQDHPSGNQTLLFSIGNGNSNVHVVNSLSKGGGSFRIAHPHPSKKYTHDLVHSFIEGPQMDLIYRGKVDLVDGTATVNIDTKSNMTDGTFVLLNRDVQCFTSNETGWTAVKGSVSGNILTITAQDNTCTDTISWMVVGERQDDKIKSLDMTDDDGNLIVEPLTIEETHM